MRVRAPRVAVVFGTFPPERNGGADFVARFARALAEANAEVHVLTSPSTLGNGRDETVDGVSVHRVVDDWTLGGPGARQRLRRLDGLLDDARIDVVHVFFPDSVLQARYQLPAALAVRRAPLVSTFWNLGLGRRSPLAIKLESLALLARSAVLTSHDPAYLRVLRRLDAGTRPVHWLPVGSNLDPRVRPGAGAELRERLGLDDAPLLGYFGHLDFTRGVEDLFTALAGLRRGRDVRLLMLGESGEHGPAYRRLAADLGVGDAVCWTGYLPAPEAAAALDSVDLCVLPYRRNSLGRSALAAALELGVPTVLAGEPDAVEPLLPGRHVALVARGDSTGLESTLAALLDDEARRDELRAGAERAAPMFAWPRIAAIALGLYEQALRRRTGARSGPAR
jgi:glycosyltransferase involved in cell wall biosynthesis